MATGDNAEGDKAEAGGAKKRIDPRYDPAFQRGYRGEVRPSAPSRDRQPDSSLDRERQPGVERDDHGPTDARADRHVGDEADTEAAVEEETDLASDPDGAIADTAAPPSRVNPYLVALWIIGIGLTVIGLTYLIWAQSRSGSLTYNPTVGIALDVILINIAYTVSIPMITVGLATIVGLIFLLATHSRRGPRR